MDVHSTIRKDRYKLFLQLEVFDLHSSHVASTVSLLITEVKHRGCRCLTVVYVKTLTEAVIDKGRSGFTYRWNNQKRVLKKRGCYFIVEWCTSGPKNSEHVLSSGFEVRGFFGDFLCFCFAPCLFCLISSLPANLLRLRNSVWSIVDP